jgi:hypothetical protein
VVLAAVQQLSGAELFADIRREADGRLFREGKRIAGLPPGAWLLGGPLVLALAGLLLLYSARSRSAAR